MNLEDERLAKIESEKQNAINNSNSVYQTLNNQAENVYNQQQQYAADYQKTQDEVLDKQLANQTAKIEQQKQIATENRDTEAKRARNDYQAYINPYGVNAESLASRGLLNSGLSETSQLGGYNTYQNRVASANKALQDAITAYDNDINDAQLHNDVAKAQNALTKLEMQLKYAQSYYDTSSQLAQNSLANQQSLNSQYSNQYQAMLGQILNENKYQESIRQYNADLAEKQRQYNQNLAYQKERDRIADEQWQKEYELTKKKISSSSSRSGSGGSGGSGSKKQPISKSPTYTTTAGKEAYKYISTFISGDPNDSKHLSPGDVDLMERKIAQWRNAGMTDAEYAAINNYINANFTKAKSKEEIAREKSNSSSSSSSKKTSSSNSKGTSSFNAWNYTTPTKKNTANYDAWNYTTPTKKNTANYDVWNW